MNLFSLFSILKQRFYLSLAFIALILFLPGSVFAATFSLSPSSGNVGVGSILPVRVILNAGGSAINAVTGIISYPADKLDVSYISYSNVFDISAQNTTGGGFINFSRGNTTGTTGSVVVATIGFRGKSLGVAHLSFVSGSHAVIMSSTQEGLNLGASTGATFNVVPAPPKPTPDPAGVKINDLKITNVSTNSATINWSTLNPSNSVVSYGIDPGKYFITTSDPKLVTSHSITLNKIVLSAGTLLHFQVSSTDANTNIGTSSDESVQLTGYKLKIHLIDTNNTPLKNTKVTIYSNAQTGSTDNEGTIEFNNLTAGKHLLVVSTSSGDRTTQIGVNDTNNFTSVQDLTVKINTNPSSAHNKGPKFLGIDIIYWVGIAIVLVLVIAGIIYWLRKKRQNPPQPPVPPQPVSSQPQINTIFQKPEPTPQVITSE